MDIQQIIDQLKSKFGDKIDVDKIKAALQGINLKDISFADIVSRLQSHGLLKNMDPDALKANAMNEINDLKDKAGDLKDKAAGMLGNMFGKK